jgi:hypothetical protein
LLVVVVVVVVAGKMPLAQQLAGARVAVAVAFWMSLLLRLNCTHPKHTQLLLQYLAALGPPQGLA